MENVGKFCCQIPCTRTHNLADNLFAINLEFIAQHIAEHLLSLSIYNCVGRFLSIFLKCANL